MRIKTRKDVLWTQVYGDRELSGLGCGPRAAVLKTGGRGTPLFKLPRYVPPHRVGFLRRFGLKSGMVFEGTTRVYNEKYNECIKRNMRIQNGFEEFFCLRSNLSTDDNTICA